MDTVVWIAGAAFGGFCFAMFLDAVAKIVSLWRKD